MIFIVVVQVVELANKQIMIKIFINAIVFFIQVLIYIYIRSFVRGE